LRSEALDARGEEFKLDREYVKNGLRSVAQHFATVQLGYRTEQDATLALPPASPAAALHTAGPVDRGANSAAGRNLGDFRVTVDPTRPGLGRFAAVREQSLASRLMTLQTMGLARPDGPHQWQVRRDLETALKSHEASGG
jgi:hypothetical protein